MRKRDQEQKPETWWAIKSHGMLLPWTAASQRKLSMKAFIDAHENLAYGDAETMKKSGFCVPTKIIVTEVKRPPSS